MGFNRSEFSFVAEIQTILNVCQLDLIRLLNFYLTNHNYLGRKGNKFFFRIEKLVLHVETTKNLFVTEDKKDKRDIRVIEGCFLAVKPPNDLFP